MIPEERRAALWSTLLFLGAGIALTLTLRPGADLPVILEDGHHILNEGMPPILDPHSFAGDPRVELEPVSWLTGATFALVEWIGRWRGLRALATLTILGGLLLLWRGASASAPPGVRMVALALVFAGALPGLEVSDVTPAFLMTSWLTFLMLRFPSDPGVARQLPVLIWTWALTSPTWIAGLALAWVWILGTFFTWEPEPGTPPGSPELRTLATMGLAALVVPIVTPASFGGYSGAFAVLAARLEAADLLPGVAPSAAQAIWILLVAGCLPLASRGPAGASLAFWPVTLLALADPAWWAPAAVLAAPTVLEAAAAAHARGAWRFAIVAALSACGLLGTIPPSHPPPEDPALRHVAELLEATPRESRGNTLTELEWGVPLGRLAPASQVVATRRLAAFDNGVIEDLRDLIHARQVELLDMYGIAAVVLRPGRPLVRMLARFRDWELVWKSQEMVIFQRPWHWARGGRPVTLRIPRRGENAIVPR